jgi:hypothetical protein
MATFVEKVRSTTSLAVATPAAATGGTAVDAIIISPTANTANADVVTITNHAHGQATTYTIQDIGAASGNLVNSATLVNGNLVSASAAGSLQDSTITSSSVSGLITQVGNVATVSVTLTPSQVVTAYTTPVTLIAAPGAGKVIVVQEASVYTASTGNTAYATGTAPIIQYGTTAHGGGTSAVGSGLVAGDITAATSQVRCLVGSVAALTAVSNLAITFSNATGVYTAGTGTNVTFNLTYQVITATV